MLLDLSELEARLTGLRAVSVLGPDADYFFVSGRNSPLKLGLETGRTVSVFSLAGVAHGVTLRGFRFRPEGGTLGPSSHGLSNEVIQGEICRVGLRQGRLVVIAPPLKVT